MGMTIDELMRTAQKYNCMIVTKDMWNTAIVFSHKLQKIEQIVKEWREVGLDYDSCDAMDNIERVIENA